MSEPIKRTFKFVEYASRERLEEEYERICEYAVSLEWAASHASAAIYDAVMRIPLKGNQDIISAMTDAKQAIDAALAKNPNPSGHIDTEASGSEKPEASGPVGLGPDVAEVTLNRNTLTQRNSALTVNPYPANPRSWTAQIAWLQSELSHTRENAEGRRHMLESILGTVKEAQALCACEERPDDPVRAMLERAVKIMGFHTGRCPMNIMRNFSGMEEHLAEYRAVMREGNALLDASPMPSTEER
jgi:hypothetical protein